MVKINYYNWQMFGVSPLEYREIVTPSVDAQVLVNEANRLLCFVSDEFVTETMDIRDVEGDILRVPIYKNDRRIGETYIWFDEIPYVKGGENLEF